ncbi:MAG: iron-containing alcohol dehydrogenase, partial [Gammaproteobacteria bacterium]
MNLQQFQIAALPQIVFGEGTINQLPDYITSYGKNILIVTGASSFCDSNNWQKLQTNLKKKNIEFTLFKVNDEPSTKLID